MNIVSPLYVLLVVLLATMDGGASPVKEESVNVSRTDALLVDEIGDLNMPAEKLTSIVGQKTAPVGNVQYTIVLENRTWWEAQIYCKFHLMDFATVRNENESQQILGAAMQAGVLSNDGNSFWIGGTDLESDRGFYWVTDLESLSYTNWHVGQPSVGDQHCMDYWLQNGLWKWDNNWCDDNRTSPFACEHRS